MVLAGDVGNEGDERDKGNQGHLQVHADPDALLFTATFAGSGRFASTDRSAPTPLPVDVIS